MQDARYQFMMSFSERLVFSLKKKGHASSRANSGVKTGDLAEAIGLSKQMARKYVLGKALPYYQTVLDISEWLSVDPGWLLFGDIRKKSSSKENELLGINYDLMGRILLKSFPLFKNESGKHNVVRFLLDLIYNASHLEANKETIIKMVDMAIASANRFTSTEELKNQTIKASTES